MEVVGSVFSAVASAGSAAAGTAGSFGSFLSGSGILTGLQAGTGLLALAAKNRASVEAKAANFEKAAESELDAQAEGVAGQSRAVQIRKALVGALAERDNAAAAGGLDLGWGSPVVAREQASADAERELSLNALETEGRQARLRQRSAAFIRAGRNARSGGLLDMLATGVNTVTDMGTRGTVPKLKAA